LFTNKDASRHNFIHTISGYTIVNIFSHALSDTTVKEPVLYMYDSAIYLSELQLLQQPATQLIVLSACQTTVGKNAKGEGIFSLARGFAAAGVPSVTATLWNADEESLYAITEKFHEYLSQGMPKDEALQKAKLYFIQNGEHEKPYPYYWANIILVGNNEPVTLSENHHTWRWIAGIIFITAILSIVQFLKNRRDKSLS
jgi:CHAT domain-containing protein